MSTSLMALNIMTQISISRLHLSHETHNTSNFLVGVSTWICNRRREINRAPNQTPVLLFTFDVILETLFLLIGSSSALKFYIEFSHFFAITRHRSSIPGHLPSPGLPQSSLIKTACCREGSCGRSLLSFLLLSSLLSILNTETRVSWRKPTPLCVSPLLSQYGCHAHDSSGHQTCGSFPHQAILRDTAGQVSYNSTQF